ncbi:hypothetical protein ACVW1B_008470 [Bradyrhizobium sp. USDA 4502]
MRRVSNHEAKHLRGRQGAYAIALGVTGRIGWIAHRVSARFAPHFRRELLEMMVRQAAPPLSVRGDAFRRAATAGCAARYFCLGRRPFSFSMSLTFIFMPPGMMMSPAFWSLLQAPSHFASMVIVVSREPAAPPSAWEVLFTV